MGTSIAKLQTDAAWLERFGQTWKEAVVHVQFFCRLYGMHMAESRYWLHVHPGGARSWKLVAVKAVLRDPPFMLVEGHQCMFGLMAPLRDGSGDSGVAEKRSGAMTNSTFIAEALNQKCDHFVRACSPFRRPGREGSCLPGGFMRSGLQMVGTAEGA